MASSWYLYFPLLLGLWVITKHFLNKFQNRPPSPFPCLPIIGHLHLLKRPIHRTLYKITKQHGPIVFLQFGSRKVLVVSSPSAADDCLNKNDIIFANRPKFNIGKIFGYNYTIMSWASYGDHWRNLRRIASLEILSTFRLQLSSNIRTEEVNFLIRKLLNHHQNGQPVELRTKFFELTMNIMMRMIAGKRYYSDNHIAGFEEEANRFKEIHSRIFKLAGMTYIGDFLPWIRSKKLDNMLVECQRDRDEFMQALIEEHRSKRTKISDSDDKIKSSKTLLGFLLDSQESQPEYYTDQIIKGLMMIILLAGTDTTVNTIEWALSLMLNNPESLTKAQEEIDNHVGHDRLIAESDVAHLPYLRCIMSETLRMYPPAPLLSPHESSEECKVGGFSVPGGTTLFVNLWGIQNDPEFWDDPAKFKPERFEGLEGTRDGFRSMPFGSGRRGCPGEGLGLRMVGLTLGTLIQCFEWERIGGDMVDMSKGAGFTMAKAHPLRAKCRPRPTMLKLLLQI